MDNEFILFDRIQKIKSIIEQHKEENCYISYSGGKDSNVLDKLFDLALPDNKIPRVYCDTGIELNAVRDFVREKAEQDSRVIIIQPKVPIKKMLETVGYPFKSKAHSRFVDRYQRGGWKYKSVRAYTGREKTLSGREMFRPCPKSLLYQFSDSFNLKISDKCCEELKEIPLGTWAKENNKKYRIVGLMREEGGRRTKTQCLAFRGKKLEAFHPLAPITKEWENWFIEKYGIKLPILYYPPYNFDRTGCKGCPFGLHLQQELDTLQKYFPGERKQCELIWKPVYAEYRKLNYRLKEKNDQLEF